MAESQRLTGRRCRIHGAREAAARCPGCARYFCRECVTEHEDLALCAECISSRTAPKTGGVRWHRRFILRPVAVLLAIVVAWLYFLLLGWATMEIPRRFHSEPLISSLEDEQ